MKKMYQVAGGNTISLLLTHNQRRRKMERKIKRVVLLGLMVGFLNVMPALAVCPPGMVPMNPAPEDSSVPIAEFFDNFSLGENQTETVTLKKGQSYWFAANGCPRMGRINISIIDSGGKTLKRDESFSPSFCFTAPKDGDYTVKVMAITLQHGNSFGGIKAKLSDSGCSVTEE